MIVNFFKKHWDQLFKILIFIVPVSLFIFTVAHFPSGFSDSDELLLAGAQFSLAHPPGYSLTTLLLNIIFLLFPIHYVFFANFLSAIFSGLTTLVLYLILKFLVKKNDWQSSLLMMSISLVIPFSTLIWQYANIWEVFSLSNFLLLLSIYCSFKISVNSKSVNWLILGLIYGLGITHHQLFILSIPALIYILWSKIDKKFIFPLFIGTSATIIVYLSLIILQSKNPGFAWDLQPGINGMLRFILRKDFVWGGYWLGFSFIQFWDSIKLGLMQIGWNSLSPFIFSLGLVGIYLSYKNLIFKQFIPLLYLWLMYAIFLVGYLPFSQGDKQLQSLVINSRMYLSGFWLWGIWVGLAIYYFYKNNKDKFIILLILCLFLVFWQIKTNFELVKLTNYRVPSNYAKNTLKSLPQKSVLICFSDLSCFSLAYAQNINKIRTDIILVPITPQLQNQVRTRYPQLFKYDYPDQYLQIDYVIASAWKENYRVFLAEVSDEFAQQLQLSHGIGVRSFGDNWEVSCNFPNNIEFNSKTKFNFSKTDSGRLHQQIIQKQRKQAKQLIDLQFSNLKPKPDQCFSEIELLSNAKDCQKAGDKNCYYQNILLASIQNPQDKDLHLKLMEFYKQQGFIDLVEVERTYSRL